jgi:hypothetical protein
LAGVHHQLHEPSHTCRPDEKKEFLSLKQGEMSVAEFWDKFNELSLYAPEDVADDGKK